MADEETLEVVGLQEEPWEERTLNLLHASKIDQYLAELKAYKSGRKKKHKLQLLKKPTAIPALILELQDQSIRESALRCLSNFLLEVIP